MNNYDRWWLYSLLVCIFLTQFPWSWSTIILLAINGLIGVVAFIKATNED